MLSKITSKNSSLFLIILYIATPWQYFYERTFMPESFCLFFVIFFLWIFSNIPRITKSHTKILAALAGSFIVGLLMSLKPLFSLFVLVGLLAILVRIQRHFKISKYSKVLLITTCVIVGFSPVASLSITYEKNYGIFSPSPASGTMLAARWGNLIQCERAKFANQSIVHEAILDICEQPIGSIPGIESNIVWKSNSAIGATLEKQPDFSLIQQELRSIVFGSIVRKPYDFNKQVISGFFYPFVHSVLPNDLVGYQGSGEFYLSENVKKYFNDYSAWFKYKKVTSVEKNNEQHFQNLMAKSLFIPTGLMLVFLIFKFMNIADRLYLQRKKKRIQGPKNTGNSGYIGLLFLSLISIQLMVVLSGLIIFRYYFYFIPIWIILIGIEKNDWSSNRHSVQRWRN
jgi:hypothetical protein